MDIANSRMPRRDDQPKRISVVLPIYNEAGNVPPLMRALDDALANLPYEIEICFINDGSTDTSLDVLRSVQLNDERVIVVDFARNYGHQLAVTAGLDLASGDAVIIMDSDLQDPPEVVRELIEKWEAGWDVVYAQRRTRKDSLFKRMTAAIFYRALEKMADVAIPRDTGDFRMLDRKVVEELKKFREHDRFVRGMVSYVGFRQTAVLFDRDERHSGKSGYPLRKMIKLASDGIFGFSTYPLRLISRIGTLASIASVFGILYVLFVRFFVPEIVVSGWAFIVISVLFMGGLQLIMLGVLGEYVGRVYREVQNRPLYAVNRIHGVQAAARAIVKNT